MRKFLETEFALLLRTDYTDEAAWIMLCKAIQEPHGEFQAYVECLSDPIYDDISLDEILSAARDTNRTFLFVVDRDTLTHPDHPILCMDLFDQPGRTFQVIPSEMWSVENNLSLANMDFNDFALSVDQEGVFRGFPG